MGVGTDAGEAAFCAVFADERRCRFGAGVVDVLGLLVPSFRAGIDAQQRLRAARAELPCAAGERGDDGSPDSDPSRRSRGGEPRTSYATRQ